MPDGPGLPGHQAATISSVNSANGTDSVTIWRRIRRDVVLLGAGNVGIVVTQLVFRSILIATLVPADYGRLSLILGVYNTVWIIGASGLPNSVARYMSVIGPGGDSAMVRTAIRATAWPTVVAATITAIVAGALLNSAAAFLFAALGLVSLVYALLAMGILRGRGRIASAASVMPIGGVGEVGLLVILLLSGLRVTPLSAFAVFCIGNVIGLAVGIVLTRRTVPRNVTLSKEDISAIKVPSARQLLSFSMWLAATTAAITILPLILRLAAVVDSYTAVAVIDVALVLLALPQRLGAVIVAAVIPHATRALDRGKVSLTISRREHIVVIAPFVIGALVVAFTPIVGWAFGLIGRPQYEKSAEYLALALLAGPARILYGLVEGVLVAHGEGKFLALNAWAITILASAAILTASTLGSIVAAFAVFVTACWGTYLIGLRRIVRIDSTRQPFQAATVGE